MKVLRVVIFSLFLTCSFALAQAAAPAPTCPTGVNHCASVAWQPNPAGGVATGFNVYHSTTNGGCATLTASTCTKVGSTTAPTATFLDTPLAAKTTYYWVITASNGQGESVGSSQATGTTADDVPGQPQTIIIVLH